MSVISGINQHFFVQEFPQYVIVLVFYFKTPRLWQIAFAYFTSLFNNTNWYYFETIDIKSLQQILRRSIYSQTIIIFSF